VDAPRLLNATVAVGHGLSGWVARNRRTLVNANPRVSFDAAGVPGETDLNSAIVCPLFFGDAFIGTLALYHTEANRYTVDHRRLIERVAEQAGAVIHYSIVFEQTQEDSLTDPLTGLPNRRSLFVHLTREIARAERLKGEVAMIVMDIDEFKTINDTYGHHVGDRACVRWPRRCRPGCGPTISASAMQATSSSSCSRNARARPRKRRDLQQRVSAIEFEGARARDSARRRQRGRLDFPTEPLTRPARRGRPFHVSRQGRPSRPHHFWHGRPERSTSSRRLRSNSPPHVWIRVEGPPIA
jgi:hypothetical protein